MTRAILLALIAPLRILAPQKEPMASTLDVDRFRENLQAEYDAIALYTRLAKAEPNAELAKVYQRLAETESRHAEVWASKLREAG